MTGRVYMPQWSLGCSDVTTHGICNATNTCKDLKEEFFAKGVALGSKVLVGLEPSSLGLFQRSLKMQYGKPQVNFIAQFHKDLGSFPRAAPLELMEEFEEVPRV